MLGVLRLTQQASRTFFQPGIFANIPTSWRRTMMNATGNPTPREQFEQTFNKILKKIDWLVNGKTFGAPLVIHQAAAQLTKDQQRELETLQGKSLQMMGTALVANNWESQQAAMEALQKTVDAFYEQHKPGARFDNSTPKPQ